MKSVISEYWAGKVRIDGKGGKEKILARVFPKSQRHNAALFDLVDNTGHPRELKKQANTQWFDIGKYHLVSPAEKDILMTFIMHDKGKIQSIFEIKLGEMLDLLTSNKEYRKWGWTSSNMQMCAKQKKLYPTQQAKVKVEVKKFYKENKEKFNLLWER